MRIEWHLLLYTEGPGQCMPAGSAGWGGDSAFPAEAWCECSAPSVLRGRSWSCSKAAVAARTCPMTWAQLGTHLPWQACSSSSPPAIPFATLRLPGAAVAFELAPKINYFWGCVPKGFKNLKIYFKRKVNNICLVLPALLLPESGQSQVPPLTQVSARGCSCSL